MYALLFVYVSIGIMNKFSIDVLFEFMFRYKSRTTLVRCLFSCSVVLKLATYKYYLNIVL